MKLQNILSGIREAQNVKTAAAAPVAAAPAPAATESRLSAALNDAVATHTKTAAAAAPVVLSPAAEVMKVAEQLADSEKAAALKEASLLGAAYADSFISRISEWQKVAGELGATISAQPAAVMTSKVAAELPSADDTFKKFAYENPVHARQAIALGYAPTAAGLEKMAEDSYVQGYNDQVTEIHKIAAEEFLKAAAKTSVIIEANSK